MSVADDCPCGATADAPDAGARTSPFLLTKGLEEEVYTGTREGDIEPLSQLIAADLASFTTEPDGRNVEFTTTPHRTYRGLLDDLMGKRCRLRRWLGARGRTLVPGGTLSLAPDDTFYFSDPDKPYYRFIAEHYGTRVVTASTHINVGIDDPVARLRAYRVLRCDAALFLALAACSPFLRGEVTGQHSTRWHVFPKTPARVPLFRSPAEHVAWVEAQLAQGSMVNHRHLWVAVRPNGQASPYDLNRLELRICDRLSRPITIAGVTALYEARVAQVLADPELDPLRWLDEERVLTLIDDNERAAAHASLDAELIDWRTGRTARAHDLVAALAEEVRPFAARGGYADQLLGVERQLAEGNLAMQWLEQVRRGRTPRQVIQDAIVHLAAIDREYDPGCPAP
ncbi:MAG: glutamate--cysteine ligase [Planctomycetota bacterium]